jgi:hypothetical protein
MHMLLIETIVTRLNSWTDAHRQHYCWMTGGDVHGICSLYMPTSGRRAPVQYTLRHTVMTSGKMLILKRFLL